MLIIKKKKHLPGSSLLGPPKERTGSLQLLRETRAKCENRHFASLPPQHLRAALSYFNPAICFSTLCIPLVTAEDITLHQANLSSSYHPLCPRAPPGAASEGAPPLAPEQRSADHFHAWFPSLPLALNARGDAGSQEESHPLQLSCFQLWLFPVPPGLTECY